MHGPGSDDISSARKQAGWNHKDRSELGTYDSVQALKRIQRTAD